MKNTSTPNTQPRCHNRIAAIMAHTSRYSFRGTSRLAKDAGVAKSTICQLTHGRSSPLYDTIERVLACLEYQIAKKLSVREIISKDGQYPTPNVCKLVGCAGCLPESAFLPDGSIRAKWAEVRPGTWSGDVCEFLEVER